MPRSDSANLDVGDALSEYLAQLNEGSLPAPVISAERLFLLDWIGVVGSGIGTPGCAQLSDFVRRTYKQAGSTVLFQRMTAPPPEAAMVNAAEAQAWELDDVFDEALVRPHSVVLAGTVAVAEHVGGVTPERLLMASALGADVLCRLARAITSPLSWSRTTTLGSIAVATACAKVLGLDAVGLRNAMGLAFCQSAGTLQASLEGKSAKRLQAGFAARAGVTAALLAGMGVDGPRGFLEGKFGYYQQYERGAYEREKVLEGLGDRFFATEVSVRMFPGAREAHPAYAAAVRLAREVDLSSGVKAVRVFLTPDAANVVANPLPEGRLSVPAALTSVRYGVACILVRGNLEIGSYSEPLLADEEILGLARGTAVSIIRNAERGAIVPAKVEIELRNGTAGCADVDEIEQGMRPEMESRIVEKFLKNLQVSQAGVSANTATTIAAVALNLESAGLEKLISLLE